jgi:hypothetical protein
MFLFGRNVHLTEENVNVKCRARGGQGGHKLAKFRLSRHVVVARRNVHGDGE